MNNSKLDLLINRHVWLHRQGDNMEEQIIHKSNNDNPVIEVVNVKKSYQLGKMEVPILHDINLSVVW